MLALALQDLLSSKLYKQKYTESFKKGAPQYIGSSKDFCTLLSYTFVETGAFLLFWDRCEKSARFQGTTNIIGYQRFHFVLWTP